MALIICRRICASKRFININLSNHTLSNRKEVNFHTLKSMKNDSIFKHKPSFLVMSGRNFFKIFRKPTKEQLRIKDNIPDAYNLIYKSSTDRYILFAQFTAVITASLLVIALLIYGDVTSYKLEFSAWSPSPRSTNNEILVYTFAFTVVFALIHIFISRVPIRIYYFPAQKKYIFIFHGNLPFSKRELHCKIGDVIPQPHNGILPWRQGRYLIKDKQHLLLFDENFRRPADLNIMLGIQRDHDVDKK